MNYLLLPTRAGLTVASCLLGMCVATTALAQEGTTSTDSPSVSQDAPAATDLAAELVTLRAEVEALKAKQEEAEATALLSQEAEASTSGTELLRIYGFMDFGIDKYFLSDDDALHVLRPTEATTFVFGNLNLYFDANPIEHLRAMVELRLTLSPNGEETELGPPIGTSYQRTDTTAFEYSDPSSQSALRLGGLYIERAWSEYQFSSLFKLQWGLFLTPFGIWNLDHGSPTLISLMLPEFIASQMVPTRLLGLHLHGSAFFGSWEMGYAVHVTNGRGPIDFDFSEDKAVGARLFFANESDFGRLVLGASGYFGTYLDRVREFSPNAKNYIEAIDLVDYTEAVAGVDFALDVGGLRIRSEGVLRWVNSNDGKAEPVVTIDGTEAYLPNRLEYAAYVLAAYRTPWRLEPYLEFETSHKSAVVPKWAGRGRSGEANTNVYFLSAGLNIELTTHTLLKTQVVWDRAYNTSTNQTLTNTPIVFIRVVTSF
jgi:hypothetical protein